MVKPCAFFVVAVATLPTETKLSSIKSSDTKLPTILNSGLLGSKSELIG